jgi:hypothetical protein
VGQLRRHVIWSALLALFFLVLAVALPIPVWGRIVLVVGAVIEFGLARFANVVLKQKLAARAAEGVQDRR